MSLLKAGEGAANYNNHIASYICCQFTAVFSDCGMS